VIAAPGIQGGIFAHFPTGVLTQFGSLLRQPVGPIHWAGAETSSSFHGSINAAIESGERTAKEVQEAIGSPRPDDLPESARMEARKRWQTARAELARDPRPIRQLSTEERQARLRLLEGIGRGLLSSSEDFSRRKAEEIEIEDRKLAR
jgi:hypothetical protein